MDTREKLVATAASLFQKEGVRATGLAQILTVSGTPKGSLYYYFPNGKAQLIEAAITYAGQHILEHVQRDLDRYKAPDGCAGWTTRKYGDRNAGKGASWWQFN
jgi:TetR/AcrR family transcriptional regulator, lmrAB and yxaGH operons repressor